MTSARRTTARRRGNRLAARDAENQRRAERIGWRGHVSRGHCYYVGVYVGLDQWGHDWKAWSCAARLGYDGTWRNTGYPFPERQEQPCP